MRRLRRHRPVLIVLSLLITIAAPAQNTGIISASVDVNYAPAAIPQIVRLRNFNSVGLTLTGLDANGDTLSFAIVSQPLLGTLGDLDPQSGQITYTPLNGNPGTDSFSFSVSDGIATSDPVTVTLLSPPLSSIAPSTLNFGKQGLASASPAKTVTFKNSGIVPVNVATVGLAGVSQGDYNITTSALPLTLAAGKTLKISLTFTPTALGAEPASLVVTSDAVASPQSVSLNGTGVEQLTLSAAILNFGKITVGASSATKNVSLTNNTSSPVEMSTILPSGDYSFTTTCGSSIAANAHCTVSVKFTPSAKGLRVGSITINDSASNTPQIVSLTGTGG